MRSKAVSQAFVLTLLAAAFLGCGKDNPSPPDAPPPPPPDSEAYAGVWSTNSTVVVVCNGVTSATETAVRTATIVPISDKSIEIDDGFCTLVFNVADNLGALDIPILGWQTCVVDIPSPNSGMSFTGGTLSLNSQGVLSMSVRGIVSNNSVSCDAYFSAIMTSKN